MNTGRMREEKDASKRITDTGKMDDNELHEGKLKKLQRPEKYRPGSVAVNNSAWLYSRGESTRAGHGCGASLRPLGARLAADYDSPSRSHSRNAEVKLNPLSNDLVVILESAISGDLFTNLLRKIHY